MVLLCYYNSSVTLTYISGDCGSNPGGGENLPSLVFEFYLMIAAYLQICAHTIELYKPCLQVVCAGKLGWLP